MDTGVTAVARRRTRHWGDPNCLVGQACGWPVAAILQDKVEAVGAFSLSAPRRRRTSLPQRRRANHGRSASSPRRGDRRANSADSLSGWVSLLAAAGGPGGGGRGKCGGPVITSRASVTFTTATPTWHPSTSSACIHQRHNPDLGRACTRSATDRWCRALLCSSRRRLRRARSTRCAKRSRGRCRTPTVADARARCASTASCPSTTRSTPPRSNSSTSEPTRRAVAARSSK